MYVPLYTPKQIHDFTINNSTSKEQYTFGKSERFPRIRLTSDVFYNIPETKMNRTSGFGYGTRSDFTKKPAGKRGMTAEFYNHPRDYDDYPSHIRGLSFKFGPGRDTVRINGMVYNRKTPGPGTYPIANRFKFGNGGPSFALKGKIHYDYNIKRNKGMPGPGTYNSVTEINKDGKYANSKIRNMNVYSFGKPTDRFKVKDERVPGPCYNIPSGIGYQYNSKYGNDRNTVLTGRIHYYKSKDNFPGPGSYLPFSEFGVLVYKYADKSRKQKEKLKKEKERKEKEKKKSVEIGEDTKENTEGNRYYTEGNDIRNHNEPEEENKEEKNNDNNNKNDIDNSEKDNHEVESEIAHNDNNEKNDFDNNNNEEVKENNVEEVNEINNEEVNENNAEEVNENNNEEVNENNNNEEVNEINNEEVNENNAEEVNENNNEEVNENNAEEVKENNGEEINEEE